MNLGVETADFPLAAIVVRLGVYLHDIGIQDRIFLVASPFSSWLLVHAMNVPDQAAQSFASWSVIPLSWSGFPANRASTTPAFPAAIAAPFSEGAELLLRLASLLQHQVSLLRNFLKQPCVRLLLQLLALLELLQCLHHCFACHLY